MKILALDTSGKAVSAAIAEDMRLKAHFWLDHGKTHAEALMPCINAVLDGIGLKPRDFDVFAAVTGPGSFTGLRIGISVAKAMAYASGAGVAGIPTHDALAKNLEGYRGSLACPLIHAREGYVYQALYIVEGGGKLIRVAEPELISIDGAAERIKPLCGSRRDFGMCVFNGDAAALYIDRFAAEFGDMQCFLAGERDMHTNASSVALLAFEAVNEGRMLTPERLMPDYLNAGYAAKAAARIAPGGGRAR
jgi:tRNA threonylcarbamoyladenosine biosynthesis protein TsaB